MLRLGIRRAWAPARATRGLLTTALLPLHKRLGAKLVPFAGYEMPLQYPEGVKAEHLHCRAAGGAALFDVSHMGQLLWHGEDRVAFLEKVVCGDIAALNEGEGRLSLITSAAGGILDDTVICNMGDHLHMVVNGATKQADMEHFQEQLRGFDGNARFEYLETQHLLALQGPAAAAVLQRLSGEDLRLDSMAFMTTKEATVAGKSCTVTRCGYTGEDGFEVSMTEADAVHVAEAMLAESEVKPTGLGARDSLRLEAGLCLYGNDIDETTSPVEAGLTWTIGGPKSRRRKEQGFLGAGEFLTPEGKLKATTRKRVGISGNKVPARADTEIYDEAGKTKIGVLTSGTFSPSLNAPLAMGYVAKDQSKEGTAVMLKVRGKMQAARVTKMPFVEARYFRVGA